MSDQLLDVSIDDGIDGFAEDLGRRIPLLDYIPDEVLLNDERVVALQLSSASPIGHDKMRKVSRKNNVS